MRFITEVPPRRGITSEGFGRKMIPRRVSQIIKSHSLNKAFFLTDRSLGNKLPASRLCFRLSSLPPPPPPPLFFPSSLFLLVLVTTELVSLHLPRA